MRTHELVLRTHFPVTEDIEKKSHGMLSSGTNLFSFVRKFSLADKEVMQRRFKVEVRADKETASISTEYLALGSMNDFKGIFELNREEFEYLKEVWK